MGKEKITSDNINNIKNNFINKASLEGYDVNFSSSKKIYSFKLVSAALLMTLFSVTTIIAASKIVPGIQETYESFFDPGNSISASDLNISSANNGMEITLISSFAGPNDAYLLFDAKDLVGDRIKSEAFIDNLEVDLTKPPYFNYSSTITPISYNNTENLLRFTAHINILPASSDTNILTPYFTENSNIKLSLFNEGTGKKTEDSVYSTGINIGELLPEIDLSTISQDQLINISGIKDYKLYTADNPTGIQQISYADFDTLKDVIIYYPERNTLIRQHINIEIPGIDWAYINGVGYNDTEIYVFYTYTDKYKQDYNSGNIILLDSKNNPLRYGVTVPTSGIINIVSKRTDDINSYTIGIADQIIPNPYEQGNWTFNFDLDHIYSDKTYEFTLNDSENFDKIDVHLSVTGVKIQWHARKDLTPYRTWARGRNEINNNITLLMKDGSIITPIIRDTAMDLSQYTNYKEYITPYFEPNGLKGIVINDTEYSVSLE